MEPVECEGGVIPLDPEWAKAAAKAAREAGAIVMCDEVQTGMGRCGSLMANTALGIDPEVVTFAKAIAGGVPMGACIFKGKGNVFKAGDHQSTFAGNPLACAAADVVLDTITAPGFFESVSRACAPDASSGRIIQAYWDFTWGMEKKSPEYHKNTCQRAFCCLNM